MAALSAPLVATRNEAVLSHEIRVAHVIIGLTVGGAETALKRLVLASPHPERILVVSLTDIGPVGEELRKANVCVEALHMRGVASAVVAVWRLSRLLRRFGADIVQTWMYHADVLGGLAARLAGIRNVVWGIRNTDLQAGVSRTTRILAAVAARLSHLVPRAIVCVAESARASHAAMGYEASKMIVIHNGVDVPSVDLATARNIAQMRHVIGVPDAAFLVGGVGRFNHYKDWANFIQAAGIVARHHPNAHFVLIGRGLDQRNDVLAAWIAAYGLDGRVSLLGEREQTAAYLAAMDLFCLSSRSEGFPNVVAEAMAAGLPCVVTDVGDSRILVGEAGLVVAKEDAQRLAEGMQLVLCMSEDQRRKMGEMARDRVIREFSIKRMSERYAALYTSLTAAR